MFITASLTRNAGSTILCGTMPRRIATQTEDSRQNMRSEKTQNSFSSGRLYHNLQEATQKVQECHTVCHRSALIQSQAVAQGEL